MAIGTRLYGWKVGILASALSAVVVMQIQQSHFMTVDNFAVFFTTLTMYAAVRIAESSPVERSYSADGSAKEPDWRFVLASGWLWYMLFGVSFGMALASRINLVPLAGMVLIAAYLAWSKAEQPMGRRTLTALAIGLVLSGVFTLITFRIVQPMSFRATQGTTTFLTLTPNSDWLDSMKVASSESRGIGGGPPGEQWTNRLPIQFPLTNMVIWGMGLPLGILVWAGFLVALAQIIRKNPNWRAHLLPVVWSGGFFLFMGTRWVKSMRYFLTIYPFLILLGAWLLIELWNLGSRRFQGKNAEKVPLPKFAQRLSLLQILSLVLGIGVVLGTALWAWGFVSAVYRQDHTRIQASKWIYQNIPGAVNILIRSDDGVISEPLPAGYEVLINPEQPLILQFTSPIQGELVGVRFGHARSNHAGVNPVEVKVVVARNQDGDNALAATRVPVLPAQADPRGEVASAEFLQNTIEKDQNYYVILEPDVGAVTLTGSVIANESWDEGLPLRLQGKDGFGQFYRGLTNEVRWQDDENKRQMFLEVLDQADYLILPSQRAIWSASRLPLTYPMTMAYYRALFDGSLDFDLAASFQAPIEFAGLYISDVGGTIAFGEFPDLPLFNDNLLSAEEAFSVYDHPPVWIFEKRAEYDLDQVRRVLNSVDLEEVVIQSPREATEAPYKDLLLNQEQRQILFSGGTWAELFNSDAIVNRSSPLAVVVWWGSIAVLGFITLPVTWLAFPGLRDRGYPMARIIGLLIVSWLSWILASSATRFTQGSIAFSVLILAAVSLLILWRNREQLVEYIKRNKWEILLVEILALGFFLFDLWIRYGNPDLWHRSMGGEKPMNFSYLNAVLKSETFPPFDPWYAGGYINYYYFGYVLIGSWIKLLGITPSIAYNLVIPTLFSFAALATYSIGYNLLSSLRKKMDSLKRISPRAAGLAAALALVLIGNLGTLRMVYDGFEQMGSRVNPESGEQMGGLLAVARGAGEFLSLQQGLPYALHEWYWNPSRAIPPGEGEAGPITEFPFFTFIYADLHAHMIGLPLTIACLAWLIGLLLWAESSSLKPATLIAPIFIGALMLGSLRPTNTWDYPVYWALGAVAIVGVVWLRDKKFGFSQFLKAGLICGILFAAAYILYLPYHYWYGQGYTAAELWGGSKTNLSDYLIVHGLFIFLILVWFMWETRRWMAATPISALGRLKSNLPYLLLAALLTVALIGLLTLNGYLITPLVVLVLLWAGLLFLRPNQPIEKRILLAFIAVSVALTFLVEVVVLRGDISRMNTVFKFYYQVWSLMSISAAVAFVILLGEYEEMNRTFRRIWLGIAVFLLVGAVLYPVTAASAKIRDRMDPSAPRSLDGMLFMRDATYHDLDQAMPLEDDYQAIRWMMENVEGSPVIVEANLPEYRWGTRYTIYTGLPGVLGWNWHQRQQRVSVPNNDVFQRAQEITNFYMTRDIGEALSFLNAYQVEFIVLGELERLYFENLYNCRQVDDSGLVECDLRGLPVGMVQPELTLSECVAENPDDPQSRLTCPTHGLDKFSVMLADGLLRKVYASGDTTIFEVVR
jgi:YYY domain-containing protein